MGRYHFIENWSCDDMSAAVLDIVKSMRLVSEAFGVPGWLDSDGQIISLTTGFLEPWLRSSRNGRELEEFGALRLLESTGDRPSIYVTVGTSGEDSPLNGINVDFTKWHGVPNLRFFRKLIKLVHPVEAQIFEFENDRELTHKLQQKPWPWMPEDGRPTALHWFHYLDYPMVQKLGGLEHCLKTPAHKVEPFCDGALIQLTEEPFEPDNPQHLEIQQRAMEHLGVG
jgi:hypothetical protein